MYCSSCERHERSAARLLDRLAAQDVELDQLERQVEHDGGPKRGDVELHEAIAHASDAENELRVLKAECAVLRECVGMERYSLIESHVNAQGDGIDC
jgi:hypothetical protein